MRIKIAEAAAKLQIPEQSLRCWIQSGKCKFGEVMIDKRSKYGRRTYYINGERLELYLQGKL